MSICWSIFIFVVVADLNDFNNTVIRITFDPDEDTDDNERAAPIPIIDDLVNEADEQVFIVQLHLVNSSVPHAINLSLRAASSCKRALMMIVRQAFLLSIYPFHSRYSCYSNQNWI